MTPRSEGSTRPIMITGASSGIGLELARIYARQGKPLVLIARNEERLDATATELRNLHAAYISDNATGPAVAEITTVSLDVSDSGAIEEKLGEYVQTCGTPELLINAAGVVNVGRFLEMDKDFFDANLRIDLDGTVNVCRAIAPRMVDAGDGHIVNVASVAGFLGIYGYTGYASAKYAVMGFSEALRFEMKPLGVAVSVVCPPDTKTPGFATEQAHRPPETEAIAGTIAPLDPAIVAKQIVSGINSRRFYIIIGATSNFYFRLKGLLPEVFLAIVDSDVRKAKNAGKKSVRTATAAPAIAAGTAPRTGLCAAAASNGHLQTYVLHDIVSPSACLPEHNAMSRGGPQFPLTITTACKRWGKNRRARFAAARTTRTMLTCN